MAQYPAEIALSSIDGTNGFRLAGFGLDNLGVSVSAAGDVNGDGFADVLVGANLVDQDASSLDNGRSYVVFGKASGFPASLSASSLNGTSGAAFRGVASGDGSGISVSGAGDVNGDGIADFVIGARGADNGGAISGSAYVVFGNSGGFPASVPLSSLDGTNGFRLDGSAYDQAGLSVSDAGDVNGDGIADLIVGMDDVEPSASSPDSAFIVFGSAGGFAPSLSLADLDGTNGFRLDGVGRSGTSVRTFVSGAGDINGDGIADIMASGFDAAQGLVHVLFGSESGFPASLSTADIDGSNGFNIEGIYASSIAAAGDVNADGIADIVVSSEFEAPDGVADAGATYVVFGRSEGFGTSLNLSLLDGTNGFRLDGAADERSGRSVSGAGDVNGDGFDDVIVGSGSSGRGTGKTYVVFGAASGFAPSLDLASLDGTDGFLLSGANTGEFNGDSVSGAGDVNGDGLDDIVVGAPGSNVRGNTVSGKATVVFGRMPDEAVTRIGTEASQKLVGSAFDDTLSGLGGDDRLYGHAGADLLDGGTGFDRMWGGAGSDTYVIDSTSDVVDENSAGADGVDTVQSSLVSIFLNDAVHFKGAVENATLLGSGNLDIAGTVQANTLIGNAGVNILNGLQGADTLRGLLGDDTYVIDNTGDVVDESAAGSGGTDTIQSARISVSLINAVQVKGAVENVTLTGIAALYAIGNEQANTLTGNSGANLLNGRQGADTMMGGAGADTYVIDNAGDVVDESVSGSGGADTVQSSNLSINLGNAAQFRGEVENATLTGTLKLNATGNGLTNTLVGNSAANMLDGGAGNDLLRGLDGSDTYVVDSAADVVDESLAGSGGTDTVQAGVSVNLTNTVRYRGEIESVTLTGSAALSATGNALANVLTGNDGVNFLAGREGADVLTGGQGSDQFVFDTAVVSGVVDAITDFANAANNNDTIRLSKAVFGALTGSPNSYLSAGQFAANTDGVAQDGDDRIVYNTASGALFFDADGNTTDGAAAVQFAQLGLGTTHPALTNLDFYLV